MRIFLRVAILPALSALVACALLSSCESLYTKRVVFHNHPVALRVSPHYVDEDSPLEYRIYLRNVGREVMSFDYTVSDEPSIPHIDADGPNSGLVENLYPGAEVEVKNPTNRKAIWTTLGTVVYGKKTADEIEAIYRPTQAMSSTGGDALAL